MAARNPCCCTSGHLDDSFTEVINRLHLKEGVVTEEECKDIYRKNLRPKPAIILASLLSLVLCTKSVEQSKVATKILEGYRTDLTKLTLRYLPVLSELYENGLITSDDVQEMKRIKGNLMARLMFIQCGKEADIIPKTAEIIRRHDFTEESKLLTALGDISQEGLLSKEEVGVLQKTWEGSSWWTSLNHICVISCTKEPSVMTRIADILQNCGLTGQEAVMLLKALGEISQEGLMSKEEVGEIQKQWERSHWWTALNHACAISFRKESSVMTRIADILQVCGLSGEKDVMLLKALGDISQDALMSKEEVQQVPKCWEGFPLETALNSIFRISCTKEPSVMTRIADILLKSGFTDQKHVMLLRALCDISQEGLMSKEEFGELQKKCKGFYWGIALNYICAISCTKESSVMMRIVDILQKCGLTGQEEVMLLKVTVVSKLLEKNLLTDKLFVGKEIEDMWGQFVDIFVHQCPRPLEISLETAKVFEEYGMMEEAKCVRAGSKAIHQVFGGERSTAVDASTGTAAMKVVSGVLGVLLLHEGRRYSLVAGTAEDELIVKFRNVSELCSRVLPEEMEDVEWNVVRPYNPVHFDITNSLMAVGVSHELGEKTGKLIEYYWEQRLSRKECDKVFSSKLWKDELMKMTKSQIPFGPSMTGSSRRIQSHGVARQHPDPLLPSRRTQSHPSQPWYQKEKSTHPIISGSTLTSGYDSMASSIHELPQQSEIEPDFLTPIEILKQKEQSSHLGQTVSTVVRPKLLDPTPSSGGNSDPPERKPGPDHDHESHLLEQCWIPFGIQTLHITQNEGEFLLEPATPERSDVDGRAFRMEVPATAISRDSLEVRYGIILDGPFALPSGYRLASPVVYVWFDHSKVTKSLKLHIPHWIAGDHGHLEEDVSFVISPHVLPEGEQMYTFTPMESKCTSLHDTFGTVELSGRNSLIGEAMKAEIPSNYTASAWEKVEGSNRLLRVAITYTIPFWLKVLEKYWKNWRRGHESCASLEFKKHVIKGRLSETRGKCWDANLVLSQIRKDAVCYDTCTPKKRMKEAVKHGLYPPFFSVNLIQNNCYSDCRTWRKVANLIIEGFNGDNVHVSFSVEAEDVIVEEPVSPSVGTQELAGLNREESVSPEQETNSFQTPMRTGDIPHPPSTSAWDTSPSQHPQSLEFYSLTPSDVGLNNFLLLKPLWQFLAVNLGVPVDHVQVCDTKPLGGLLALKYWRDGLSGKSYPSTWRFLLQQVEATLGTNIAKDLENKAINNPTWSKDQQKK